MVAAVGHSATPDVHGFPVALTSFVGRAADAAAVASLLERDRLVTLTGPGGAGKTRLACELGRQVADRFADGAWLVELAAVRDAAQVPAAVAAALGVHLLPASSTSAPAEVLAHALATRQLLLVLDNCEHVITAVAQLCAALLLAADDVRILATSREPLRIAGEARYRLGPLALPDPDGGTDVSQCPAVAMFADRARQADAGFTLSDQTTPVVARLVARLDGMPLAIELAAARVESLGVTQLLDRIDDRLALLVNGDRMSADRQQSLAATVEWSYRLLDDNERRVFRAVCVFPGPFTLEGAEAVAGPDSGPVVLRLVDCSLLTPPRTGPDGRSRYALLETLRTYGRRLLTEAGEADVAEVALARYAFSVVAEAAPAVATRTWEMAGITHMDADEATLRQGLAWAVEHDAALGLQLALAQSWWWLLRGRLVSHLELLTSLVEQVPAGGQLWCWGHVLLGQMLAQMADPAGAADHFTLVIGSLADGELPFALVTCLSARATALLALDRVPEAVRDGERSLAHAQQAGLAAGESAALAVLAIAACYSGDRDAAVQLARQSLRITAEIPGSLSRIGSQVLATALTEAGDFAAAERVCADGLASSREVGDVWSLGGLLTTMATLDLRAGRAAEAAAHLQEQLQIVLRAGAQMLLLGGLGCCAQLCAATGRPAEAITLDAAVWQHRGMRALTPLRHHREQPLNKAREALGPDGTRAATERGTAMNLVTAAEYALMLIADTQTSGAEPAARSPDAADHDHLSARERELVRLVAQGFTNAQIAAKLYISVRTVGSHLDRIRDKTGCRRRADLTRLALTTGLV
jgi:predicted ATPase/DNA-binding CsgD family transcriptional regulator